MYPITLPLVQPCTPLHPYCSLLIAASSLQPPHCSLARCPLSCLPVPSSLPSALSQLSHAPTCPLTCLTSPHTRCTPRRPPPHPLLTPPCLRSTPTQSSNPSPRARGALPSGRPGSVLSRLGKRPRSGPDRAGGMASGMASDMAVAWLGAWLGGSGSVLVATPDSVHSSKVQLRLSLRLGATAWAWAWGYGLGLGLGLRLGLGLKLMAELETRKLGPRIAVVPMWIAYL